MKFLKVLVAIICGVAVALVLFPFGGVTGCGDGPTGGGCQSWSTSVLFRYSGENAAPWMLIAVVAGITVGMTVYFILKRVGPSRSKRQA